MNQLNLNQVPEFLSTGKWTVQRAVNELALFITENPALFGLHKKDEDFVSDVVLLFIEKGSYLLDRYKPELSTFFTYFYLCIKSISSSHRRSLSNEHTKEFHTVAESISNFEISSESYRKIDFRDFEKPAIPYSYKPVSYEFLQIACKTEKYHLSFYDKTDENQCFIENPDILEKIKKLSPIMAKRILVVLALKSSYYITDSQIHKICTICNLDKTKFQDIIQHIKNIITDREKNKNLLELRRNKAYYHHKKYKSYLEYNTELDDLEKAKIQKKYNLQTHNWEVLNHQLEKGKVLIRPTTRLISQILGISERQVHYYQKNARELGITIDEV